MRMMLRLLDNLFSRTICNVKFGILMLVLIAVYIAVGSGVASVREYFEMDELAFFNAWPLKILMFLLVVTLITVTLQRIPLTVPRYGVWMVHVGIVTLIGGGAYHYANKLEGAVLIPLNASVTRYYDRWERALFLKTDGAIARVALSDLPRFNAYANEYANADYLARPGLQQLSMSVQRSGTITQTAAEALGVKQVSFNIVGYWPYATIGTRLTDDPSSTASGFSTTLPDLETQELTTRILMGSDIRYQKFVWGDLEFEHRPVANQSAIDSAIAGARQVHQLQFNVKGIQQQNHVEVGQAVAVGATGYAVVIESFNPRFPTTDGQIVPLLTMTVKTPTQTFRRQVIPGRDKPTDWLLNVKGAGPLGQRQSAPLDNDIHIAYTFNDARSLYPQGENALAKYIFYTLPGSADATVISVGHNEGCVVQRVDASGVLKMTKPLSDSAMMAMAQGQKVDRMVASVIFRPTRQAKVEQYVEETPKQKRDRDEGVSGRRQVVRVRSVGIDAADKPFEVETLVGFNERPLHSPWQGGLLQIPGITSIAQLQLGNIDRMLPARITLDQFEAEAYGGFEATQARMLRDFRSTITLTNTNTGQQQTNIVYLNSPVKYDTRPAWQQWISGTQWIFFQSGWDNQRQQFTILGVGNRPGVGAMTVGCILIVVGIFYAFYIKPMIIKRMKTQALAKAGVKNK
jgi:hypothetical protein